MCIKLGYLNMFLKFERIFFDSKKNKKLESKFLNKQVARPSGFYKSTKACSSSIAGQLVKLIKYSKLIEFCF